MLFSVFRDQQLKLSIAIVLPRELGDGNRIQSGLIRLRPLIMD